MRKAKILLATAAVAAALACAIGMTACNVHTHVWSQTWGKDETHHWHNCTADSCDITDNSQKDGYAEHDTSNGDCVCGYKKFTAGLQYEPNYDNGSYSYIVKGIGTANDTAVIIPSEYKGKPVTGIYYGAFSGCSSLTSITIPDSVTVIRENAINRERDTRKTPKTTQKSLQMIV